MVLFIPENLHKIQFHEGVTVEQVYQQTYTLLSNSSAFIDFVKEITHQFAVVGELYDHHKMELIKNRVDITINAVLFEFYDLIEPISSELMDVLRVEEYDYMNDDADASDDEDNTTSKFGTPLKSYTNNRKKIMNLIQEISKSDESNQSVYTNVLGALQRQESIVIELGSTGTVPMPEVLTALYAFTYTLLCVLKNNYQKNSKHTYIDNEKLNLTKNLFQNYDTFIKELNGIISKNCVVVDGAINTQLCNNANHFVAFAAKSFQKIKAMQDGFWFKDLARKLNIENDEQRFVKTRTWILTTAEQLATIMKAIYTIQKVGYAVSNSPEMSGEFVDACKHLYEFTLQMSKTMISMIMNPSSLREQEQGWDDTVKWFVYFFMDLSIKTRTYVNDIFMNADSISVSKNMEQAVKNASKEYKSKVDEANQQYKLSLDQSGSKNSKELVGALQSKLDQVLKDNSTIEEELKIAKEKLERERRKRTKPVGAFHRAIRGLKTTKNLKTEFKRRIAAKRRYKSKDLRLEKAHVKKQLSDVTLTFQEHMNQYGPILQQNTELSSKLTQLGNINNETDKLRTQIESAAKELNLLTQAKIYQENRANQLLIELEKLKVAGNSLVNDHTQLQNQTIKLNQQLQETEQRRLDAETLREEANNKFELLTARLERRENELSALNQSLTNELNALKQSTNTKISKQAEELNKLQQQIVELNQQISEKDQLINDSIQRETQGTCTLNTNVPENVSGWIESVSRTNSKKKKTIWFARYGENDNYVSIAVMRMLVAWQKTNMWRRIKVEREELFKAVRTVMRSCDFKLLKENQSDCSASSDQLMFLFATDRYDDQFISYNDVERIANKSKIETTFVVKPTRDPTRFCKDLKPSSVNVFDYNPNNDLYFWIPQEDEPLFENIDYNDVFDKYMMQFGFNVCLLIYAWLEDGKITNTFVRSLFKNETQMNE
jgi:hypothetical protein